MTASEEAPSWDPGVVAKLSRARKLVEELKAAQVEARETAQFEYETVDNLSEQTNPLVWREWRRGYPVGPRRSEREQP